MTKKQRTGTLYKRGNVYWLKYTLGGKRVQQSLGVTTEVEAEKERNRVMAPFRRADERDALAVMVKRLDVATTKHAQAEDETNPPLLLKNAFDEYRNATNRPDAGDATLDQYEVQFGLFNEWIAKTYPGATTMRQVSRAIADEFAAHLKASGRSSNTFNKYVRLLDLVFRVLKDKARLTENPWESIQRKRVVQRGRRELTIEELRTVCQSAEGELRLLLALGLYTGLRLGDCATLRWGEVDMKRSEIRRIPNKIARRKPHEVRIPIHPVLSAMLAEIIPSERGEFVLPDMAAKYERHQTYVTDIVQAHFDTCKIRTIKQGTGIEMSKDAEGKSVKKRTGKRAVVEVGFHSLRHSFVSLCREANAPLAVVEAIVGHSNPAMTRHYTHLSEGAAVQAVSLLPSVMGNETPALPAAKTVNAEPIRKLVETLTAENAEEVKRALLEML